MSTFIRRPAQKVLDMPIKMRWDEHLTLSSESDPSWRVLLDDGIRGLHNSPTRAPKSCSNPAQSRSYPKRIVLATYPDLTLRMGYYPISAQESWCMSRGLHLLLRTLGYVNAQRWRWCEGLVDISLDKVVRRLWPICISFFWQSSAWAEMVEWWFGLSLICRLRK